MSALKLPPSVFIALLAFGLLSGCTIASATPPEVAETSTTRSNHVTNTPSPTTAATTVMPTVETSPPPTAVGRGPLSTPAHPFEAYQLQVWSEADALSVLADARALAAAASGVPGQHNTTYEYAEFVRTLDNEALLRFPAVATAVDIMWDLIYREATAENSLDGNSVAPLAGLIEAGLNSGEIELSAIGDALTTRRFSVVAVLESSTLLGAPQSVTVLQIHSNPENNQLNRFGSTAFVAIIGTTPGGYHVVPVVEGWLSSDHRGYSFNSSEDHTGNGRAEIEIMAYSQRSLPAGCGTRLSLYEWRAETETTAKFVNLTPDVEWIAAIEIGSCGRWEFVSDEDGTPSFLAIQSFQNFAGSECPPYEHFTRYVWGGNEYRWRGFASRPFAGSAKCGVGWALLGGSHEPQALTLVESALVQLPDEIIELWGPSTQDYLRLKLGLWYAATGDVDKAALTLMDVRDNPANTEYDVMSRLAGDALDALNTGGLPSACNEIVRAFSSVPLDALGLYDLAELQLTWGVADPLWLYGSGKCDSGVGVWSRPDPAYVDPLSILQGEVRAIEEALFTERDLAKARGLLTSHLDLPASNYYEAYRRPYLLYLSGLVFEVGQNDVEAVRHYWELWQNYPESLYALLAQEKLEVRQ